MIERTFDAEWFNALCNRPEVRPGLGGEGYFDTSEWVTEPRNYALRTDHGGFILVAHGAGFYSVHTQFAAEGRGRHAIEAMMAGLDFMFTRTDCMRIFSYCPDNNPATLQLALRGGAKPWFRKEHDPKFGPGIVVSWDILDWATSTTDLEKEGCEFHSITESLGMDHPHEPAHDRAVGASVRMCRHGQTRKGVILYNLWAAAAGYPPVELVSDDPPVLDVGAGVIMGMTDGEMKVLQCRSA